MNSLNRNLKKGDYVIVVDRIFVCDGGGFGSCDFTMETKMGGHFLGDNAHIVVNGLSIDADATVDHFQNRMVGCIGIQDYSTSSTLLTHLKI